MLKVKVTKEYLGSDIGMLFAKSDTQEQLSFLNGLEHATRGFNWDMQCCYISSKNNYTPKKTRAIINVLETLVASLKEQKQK